MLSVREALGRLLDAARPLEGIERVPTLEANGRVLAEDQHATINVPSADNTQMDGYAVRAADCESGSATLRVAQRIPAGSVGEPLRARHRRPHLHRGPDSARRRCGRDAGAV